ncbi:hypothetical protein OG429_03110 [Streptomyces sp. NBC_00190]|uniref:hypothetical protein n=1 Tax=unclassified Streptomyces TaxID=2593676 RepID=UPI002E2ABEE7|nr:hypothetical protein [Streptomyces sp. NBC_00190]WSZ38397.1 hypothetical protein OG239_06120 [Streptomyces sp. NBC_00868]
MTAAFARSTAWHDAGVESRERAESLSELGDLLTSLSNRPVVSVRYGRFPDGAIPGHGLGPLAGQVHDLVAELHPVWKRYLPSGAEPPSASQIEALLEPLSADAAVDLMARLAADDLVWPGSKLMNREIAHDTVTRIVKWLGPGATWWTNRQGNSWDPVTACTFDGVVAGSDGGYFAVLIQVGED